MKKIMALQDPIMRKESPYQFIFLFFSLLFVFFGAFGFNIAHCE